MTAGSAWAPHTVGVVILHLFSPSCKDPELCYNRANHFETNSVLLQSNSSLFLSKPHIQLFRVLVGPVGRIWDQLTPLTVFCLFVSEYVTEPQALKKRIPKCLIIYKYAEKRLLHWCKTHFMCKLIVIKNVLGDITSSWKLIEGLGTRVYSRFFELRFKFEQVSKLFVI